ncbi:MAG TPA: kelch repeat-containing protein [Acidimicrobiales bacterium]|nr:kelch repeat-containing protein [Acidimicrobiales bacterium]
MGPVRSRCSAAAAALGAAVMAILTAIMTAAPSMSATTNSGPQPNPVPPSSPVLEATWKVIPALARSNHTATRLQDGTVLVAGGCIGSPETRNSLCVKRSDSAEIYDPFAARWRAVRPMRLPRAGHTATLLPNGKVLVAGGFPARSDAPGDIARDLARFAEIYDPSSGEWQPAGRPSGGIGPDQVDVFGEVPATPKQLRDDLSNHTATLLAGPRCRNPAHPRWCGKVLVVASALSSLVPVAALYDAASNRWSRTTTPARMAFHTAAVLADGRVLIVGGTPTGGAPTQTYDPDNASWLQSSTPKTPPLWGTLTPLGNGKVLLAGGLGADRKPTEPEVFDPDRGAWAPAGRLATPRLAQTATVLGDGSVLVVGGAAVADQGGTPGATAQFLSSAERYDPAANVWGAAPAMSRGRGGDTTTAPLVPINHLSAITATSLLDGRVLVVGGADSTAEILTPPGTRAAARPPDTKADGSLRAGRMVLVIPAALAGGVMVMVAGRGRRRRRRP